MKKKLSYRQAFIKGCSATNDEFSRLFHIFRLTLNPGMSFNDFKAYYHSKWLQYIDVTFAYEGERMVGFLAAAFYSSDINGKKSTIGRSAIGLIDEMQGKTLPKWMLYKKYIRHKLFYPLIPLILTAYVANPIVYSMICKYTGIVYPRFTTQVPKKIDKIKNEILKNNGLQQKEKTPFVVQISFTVRKGKKLIERISNSNNVHVQFFTSQTKMQPQTTLLVLIPVSWLNIVLTSMRFGGHIIKKPLLKFEKICVRHLSKSHVKCTEIYNLAREFFTKINRQVKYGTRRGLQGIFTKQRGDKHFEPVKHYTPQ